MADNEREHEGWRQAHSDIGVVAERVNALESGFSELRMQFGTLQSDVRSGFTAQNAAFLAQVNGLADKIERQGTAYAASRNTSISGILITTSAVAGVMLTIIGAFGFVIISPVFKFEDDITHQVRAVEEQAIKRDSEIILQIRQVADSTIRRDDFKDYVASQAAWTGKLSDRLRADEDNAVSQRQLLELKDRFDERYHITSEDNRERFSRIEVRLGEVDAQLVKRPEIEAANRSQDERITTLSARMNAIQAQIDGFFPASKVIDEIWSGLREVRSGTAK